MNRAVGLSSRPIKAGAGNRSGDLTHFPCENMILY
jgi:hypothetical protein